MKADCGTFVCAIISSVLSMEMDPLGPTYRVDRCNVSRSFGVAVPSPCEKPMCVSNQQGTMVHRRLLYSKSQIMWFVDHFDEVQGMIGIDGALFIHAVSVLQNAAGVSGAIGEIGVGAGKSFITLAMTRRLGEPMFAADVFGGGEEPGNAAEYLDGRRKDLFAEYLYWANVSFHEVAVHHGSSADLTDTDMLAATGMIGYRLFHVDGCHLAKCSYHDIKIAACALVEGGVLMVDDVFSSKWMGAGEGLHRFMHVQRQILGGKGDLVPFLYVGRIYLAHRRYAQAYRDGLLRSFPGLVVGGKYLYGSEVLLVRTHPVGPDDFSAYIDGEEEYMGYSE